jgi:hypothetical protein
MLVAGTNLGRYEIRSKTGEGGMGEPAAQTQTWAQRQLQTKERTTFTVHRHRSARAERHRQIGVPGDSAAAAFYKTLQVA